MLSQFTLFDIFGVDGILILFIKQIILLLFATDHEKTVRQNFAVTIILPIYSLGIDANSSPDSWVML